jgi:hypothetical protein
VLKPMNILPLQMRLLEHFTMLLHSLLRNYKAVNIISKLKKNNSAMNLRFNSYVPPKFKSNAYKISFNSLASKMLIELPTDLKEQKKRQMISHVHKFINIYFTKFCNFFIT